MTHLIDATEMYLRTVWELDEEGITPIRARLVDRLGLSAPAVSETVARLEDEGLLRVNDDRTLSLTAHGGEIAVSVMRKHRLAELLLTQIIGLEWEEVHNEACRWEHVISDAVEKRLIEILGHPSTCPHGNPIPGMSNEQAVAVQTVAQAASVGALARVCRISEKLQVDVAAMRFLREHGIAPGQQVQLRSERGQVLATTTGEPFVLPAETAELVYVEA